MAGFARIVDGIMSRVVGLVSVLFRDVLVEMVTNCPRSRVAIWVGVCAARGVVLAGCSGSGEAASESSHAGDSGAAQEAPPPPPRLRMTPAPRHEISWTIHPVFRAMHATVKSVRLTGGHDP